MIALLCAVLAAAAADVPDAGAPELSPPNEVSVPTDAAAPANPSAPVEPAPVSTPAPPEPPRASTAAAPGPIPSWLAVPPPSPERWPDPPLELAWNPWFSMDSGSVTFASLRQIAYLHDAPLRKWMSLPNATWPQRAVGAAARALRWVLIDAPLLGFGDTVLHEAYGHGARAREGGATAYYELDLPWPYRYLSSRRGVAGLTYGAYTGIYELDTQMIAAGIEVEYLHGHLINLQMMRRGARAPYWDLLAYLDLKVAYFTVLSQDLSLPSPTPRGDRELYLDRLQAQYNLWRPGDRVALARSLQRAYVWNFIDPTMAVAAYRLVIDYLIFGETDLSIPALDVSGFKLWPGTQFSLSPFGPEVMAGLFASRGGAAAALTARTAVPGIATSVGLSAEVVGVRVRPWLELGAEVDGWLQPEIFFEQRFAFDRALVVGGRVALQATARLLGVAGVTAKVGVKSRGYVPGQPLAEGVTGFIGLSLWPPLSGQPLFDLRPTAL